MAAPRPSQSSLSSNRSRHSARVIAQTSVDARLHADFDESGGDAFDYSRSIHPDGTANPKATTAYLHQMQKGKFIQPFGCLLALDVDTARVIAYSENAPDMLTTVTHAVPDVSAPPRISIGTELTAIFTSSSALALHKALEFSDVSLLNPILVHCKSNGKPFYAITHRVTGGLIVDFEPVKRSEAPMTAAGALQSYKIAGKAISRLQLLPNATIKKLCDAVVQEVFDLTGYDRVMAYKFHDDDHGEVVSEKTKEGLDSYLGLHYPATDVPQAARFLFMKNKIRIICDCRAKHVKVVQDDNLGVDLTLCGSTLRAPHSCHLQYMVNMNSIASLVMAVVINDSDEEETTAAPAQPNKRKKLWGLVVCHNTTPRYVPFPLRYACEFLIQVFAVHIQKQFELEDRILETNVLRTQALLCDMLMRDAPLGIISQKPNIMDLVKCDGAALLYRNNIWKLGLAPDEFQIHDIARWLYENHMDSTGLSTDSLYDAGYPGASSIGDKVCGMTAVRINSRDMLFWFRSHTAAEIHWGGAKHNPNEKDDGRKMHPRSSFKAFLEVVKTRSIPWKDYEMDAIHSLQLILRNAFKENETAEGNASVIYSKLDSLRIDGLEELESVTNEMVRLIETATVPILAVDMNGLINGWNTKIAELTGFSVDQVLGKHLLKLVEDSSNDRVKRMLHLALLGKEEQNVHFEMKTQGSHIDKGRLSLVVNACASKDVQGHVVGVCFVAQDITSEKMVMDKFTRIQGDYKAVAQSPSALIPPIFGTDEFGWCCEWNPGMTKLSGWEREEVMGKMLLGEIFGLQGACCRVKDQETYINLGVVLNGAMVGEEAEKVPFGFYGKNGKYVDCLLSVNKKVDGEGAVTGVVCFLQTASPELQQALHLQRLSEQAALKKAKALTYMKRQIRNPLSGIRFSRKMLEGTNLDDTQKQLLQTSMYCQRQLRRVVDDIDLESIMDGIVEIDVLEFTLQEVLFTSISQVKLISDARSLQITSDSLGDSIMTENLYGDSLRLQQILADFMLVAVNFTPDGGVLAISARLDKNQLGQNVHLAHLELRLTHSGSGISEELLGQMFETDSDTSEEGISLLVCRKLLRLMNGDVQYLRGGEKSSFIITVELALAP